MQSLYFVLLFSVSMLSYSIYSLLPEFSDMFSNWVLDMFLVGCIMRYILMLLANVPKLFLNYPV